MCLHRNTVFYLLFLWLSVKVANGNVIFHLGFDFGVDTGKTTFNTSLHIGDESPVDHSGTESATFTTTAPVLADIWAKQAKLNAAATDKLRSTRVAVTQMKSELSDLVGSSDYIATKVELMTRYLHEVNTAFDNTAVNRFLLLQEFVQLVDELRAPPSIGEGGKKTLEYALMKMALDKHKLVELQTQILVEVLQALEMWQTYVQTQMIDVITV